jgi:FkbH-like protein
VFLSACAARITLKTSRRYSGKERKINWNDKVSNLREIAEDLNIGIDSLVFIDDSSFEVNFIKENLPEVMALQVPEPLHYYPSMLREHTGLFYKKNHTKEDSERAALYKTEESRKKERGKFDSLEQYLLSLGLETEVFIDDESHSGRMAQLTQKTNQFNFTTRRYTEADIKRFVGSQEYKTYVFAVKDKFGDYGITGLAIFHLDGDTADIDTFLMSCRVIGRNIETAFLNFALNDLKAEGVKSIKSRYIPTMKNKQVESFYDDFGFTLHSREDDAKSYSLTLKEHQGRVIDYIIIKTNK